MFLFYTTDIQGEYATLIEEEARHCTQVLRKKLGDKLNIVDGKGLWVEGEIVEITKKTCVVKLSSLVSSDSSQQALSHLHIAIAPTKNIDRLEWFMEKATEIGISEISLIRCARSERTQVRLDRLQGILVSAMKQSLKSYLPKLNELTDFKKFVQTDSLLLSPHIQHQKFIAYCNDFNILDLKANYIRQNNVTVLIGPEGDFTPEEVVFANKHGFMGCALGKNRLRTETAGLVACHTINLINS